MRTKTLALACAAVLPLLLAACTSDDNEPGASPTSTSSESRPSTPAPSSSGPVADESEDSTGTTVRFTAGNTSVDVAMADNPAAEDFISMLPLTLEFEDFSGNEKIAYPPRKLDHEGTRTSLLHHGDFLYYIPWGNVGFWYTAESSTRAEDSIVLGTYDATLDELERLEGRDVTIEAVS